MLLSFQTGFNLVNAAVVCIILESVSVYEPLLDTKIAQVFEACDCFKLQSVYFDLVDAAGVVCRQLNLLGTDFHAVGCTGLFSTRSTNFASSSSSPAKQSMSSAKRRLVIVLSPMPL